MSDAILYAIDAPQIATVKNAASFVEEERDSQEAPTASITSFFQHLLRVWPEDGSNGAVWSCEDFTYSQPAGPLLEMVFELSEFDEERLGQLREIAKQHAVHIFDPEGEVLYLVNGSEAT